MRSFKLVLMLACLGLPFMILCQEANADPVRKKAKSIDELAARYDVSSCKECHEEIYEQWETSAHSKSIFGIGARTAATIGTTITKGLMTWPYSGVEKPEDVKLKHLMLCAKCHLPQLEEATDDVAQEIVKAVFGLWDKDIRKESAEKLRKININCLICHQTKAITHKWAQGFPQRDAVYGTQEGGHDDEKYPVMKKSAILHESVFCGQCHGLGPNFEFEEPSQCATAYGSYLFAYVPEGGHESCQFCHMRKLNKGHVIPAYRDLDMAEAAVRFEVDAFAYYWRKDKAEGLTPLAVFRVEMTNKTGHGIPDGWPTPNRLILDVIAKAPDGEEICKYTKIYMPAPGKFACGEEMGRGPYEKAGLIRDTALQPHRTIVETFEIPFPHEKIERGKEIYGKPLFKEMDIDVELWYVPFGETEGPAARWNQLWKKLTKRVTID